MSLDKNLARLRKEHGLSQEKLAELLGISRQAISKWEAGITYPEISNMQELAKLYEITVDELLNDDLSEIEVEIKMDEKKCEKCGTICKKSDIYCSECGSDLSDNNINITMPKINKKKCTHCGSSYDDNDRYCPECGAKLFENEPIVTKKKGIKKKSIYIVLGCVCILVVTVGIYIWLNREASYGSAKLSKTNQQIGFEEKKDAEIDYKIDPKKYVENYLYAKGVLKNSEYEVEEEVGMSDNANTTVYHFFYKNGGTIGWYILDKSTGDISNYMTDNTADTSYSNEFNSPQQNTKQHDDQINTDEKTKQEEMEKQNQEKQALIEKQNKEKQLILEDYDEFNTIIKFIEQNLDTPPNNFYNTVVNMSNTGNWQSEYKTEFKNDIFYVYSGLGDIDIPANKEMVRKAILEVREKWETKIANIKK